MPLTVVAAIRLTEPYRYLRAGDVLTGYITADAEAWGNFYVHGLPDEYPAGFHSNYLRVPRYAAVALDTPPATPTGNA